MRPLRPSRLLKRMSFTGSPEVGRLVAEACGRNLVPVKLELGGKGAAVVFEDVDLNDTVEKLAQAITFHTGQVCCDATRWLVHQSIYDRFVEASVARLPARRRRLPAGPECQMGPVVSEKQRQRVLGYLSKGQEEGARAGPGRRGHGGRRMPRLLRQAGTAGRFSRQCRGSRRDLRARRVPRRFPRRRRGDPAGQRLRLRTGQQRLDERPDAAATRVAESMVAGNSWINAHNLFPHGVPYGGVNKSGMGGGVLSIHTYFDYRRSTSVVRPL